MDASQALGMEGVKDFVTVDDVPGSNITGGLLSLQGRLLLRCSLLFPFLIRCKALICSNYSSCMYEWFCMHIVLIIRMI